MNTKQFSSNAGDRAVVVTQVAQGEWHAVQGGLVVASGDASHRPDGRLFVSIDAWHDAAFHQLADAMLAELPTPLYTLVDEADPDMTSHWRRAGFALGRREWEYLVPTDPQVTGLTSAQAPPGVTLLPIGEALAGPLRTLDRVIREEVAATLGWQAMPAEVLHRPAGITVADASRYAVAAQSDQYVGLVRVVPVRQPRIGLIAVRADRHRRGIARALLAQVLGSLHEAGVAAAAAEVCASNEAALALFDGIGARRTGSNLELVRG
jgi:ribosomal protein S18 acetylase RimI-like enzyme